MGDPFVLFVDRLLTESTLEAAIESNNQLLHTTPSSSEDMMSDCPSHKMDVDSGSMSRKLVLCRICHDEDDESSMEIPCSCCGSLKYAHRKCVQRWCNEKGDTTCEICRQQFKPGYTAPPPLFRYGAVPTNFRGNWEVSRRDLHNARFMAMVTDRNLLDTDIDDYSAPTPRSLICCRCGCYNFHSSSGVTPYSTCHNLWSWRLHNYIVHATDVENHRDSFASLHHG